MMCIDDLSKKFNNDSEGTEPKKNNNDPNNFNVAGNDCCNDYNPWSYNLLDDVVREIFLEKEVCNDFNNSLVNGQVLKVSDEDGISKIPNQSCKNPDLYQISTLMPQEYIPSPISDSHFSKKDSLNAKGFQHHLHSRLFYSNNKNDGELKNIYNGLKFFDSNSIFDNQLLDKRTSGSLNNISNDFHKKNTRSQTSVPVDCIEDLFRYYSQETFHNNKDHNMLASAQVNLNSTLEEVVMDGLHQIRYSNPLNSHSSLISNCQNCYNLNVYNNYQSISSVTNIRQESNNSSFSHLPPLFPVESIQQNYIIYSKSKRDLDENFLENNISFATYQPLSYEQVNKTHFSFENLLTSSFKHPVQNSISSNNKNGKISHYNSKVCPKPRVQFMPQVHRKYSADNANTPSVLNSFLDSDLNTGYINFPSRTIISRPNDVPVPMHTSKNGLGIENLFLAKKTGSSRILFIRLEETYEQFKQLEKERKKYEVGLARSFPGKKISSANNIPIPRLQCNPSRVDRLIIDYFREHARVITLIAKMEHLRGIDLHKRVYKIMEHWLEVIKEVQDRRRREMINDIDRQNKNLPWISFSHDSDVLALADSIYKLNKASRLARSAMYNSMQSTLFYNADVEAEIVESNQKEVLSSFFF